MPFRPISKSSFRRSLIAVQYSQRLRIGDMFAMFVSWLGRVTDLWRMAFPLESTTWMPKWFFAWSIPPNKNN
ncbi:hypothetical protein VIBNISO65_180015 [Vibrio nigripulchritudo SO65]|nr:hypothetical protein VIBNIAM115_810015 [Vibrio nigripulchritudo AM115]CCN77125.1 hypothetical protein VIBNISO65_180015 [Vibrio nigripulchritudo SO65]